MHYHKNSLQYFPDYINELFLETNQFNPNQKNFVFENESQLCLSMILTQLIYSLDSSSNHHLAMLLVLFFNFRSIQILRKENDHIYQAYDMHFKEFLFQISIILAFHFGS